MKTKQKKINGVTLLSRYAKPYKRDMIIGGLLKWTEALFELIIPLLMSRIVDVGIPAHNSGYVWKMGGLMLLLGVLGYGFAMISQTLATRSAQKVGKSLRYDLFTKCNTLSYAELDKFGTSSLVNRIINDSQQLSWVIALLVRLVVRAPFLIIGATALSMVINLKISAIFLAASAVAAVAYYFLMTKTSVFYKKTQAQLDRLSLSVRENLSGARVVRAFSREQEEKTDFKTQANTYRDVSVKAANISSLLNPLTYALFNLAIIAVLWFGGLYVNTGTLTQGEVIALINYLTQISVALFVVANLVIAFTRAAASAARVNELLETVPAILPDNDGDKTVSTRLHKLESFNSSDTPAIEFQNVTFTYQGNVKPSVCDVSFKIFAGQTVGIIGVTGSGKTTLVNLIPRFYDATCGSVKIFGKDVKDWPQDSLHSAVAAAPQKSVLFSGTVRENLLWGNPDASDEQLCDALSAADAKSFIAAKEGGLDCFVERGGANFSGGQKQRLNIARALLKNPSILILDDSFSALDFQTDARIRHSLSTKLSSAVKVIVSQRVSSVRDANLIIVLDNGQMAGAGSHSELYRSLPLYRNIVDMQLKGVANE